MPTLPSPLPRTALLASTPPAATDPRPSADPPAAAAPSGPLVHATAESGDLGKFNLDEAVALGDGTLAIATGAGHTGNDPQPTGYNGGSFYNGASYRYASVTSPALVPAAAFDSVTPSFEAITPPGTWIHIKLAARIKGATTWTKDYSLGVWASDESTVRRHSVNPRCAPCMRSRRSAASLRRRSPRTRRCGARSSTCPSARR